MMDKITRFIKGLLEILVNCNQLGWLRQAKTHGHLYAPAITLYFT